MNTEIQDINNVANVCGYFNSNTIVNSGYGCNHPCCDDGDVVKVVWDYNEFVQERFDNSQIRKLIQKKICPNVKALQKNI